LLWCHGSMIVHTTHNEILPLGDLMLYQDAKHIHES
jgi:hypothetical protein